MTLTQLVSAASPAAPGANQCQSAAPSPTPTSPTTTGTSFDALDFAGTTAPAASTASRPEDERVASASSSAMRASPMSRRRCLGSLSRQRWMSSRTRAGVAAGSAARLGSRSRILAMVSETVSPANGRRPVRHS